MIERGAVAALNHLLSQHASAAHRLRAFAGQCVEVRCAPFPDLRLRITGAGLVERAPEDAASGLVVKLKAGALPLLATADPRARGQIEIEGPADLAAAVDELARSLRWDFEEDLSKVLGDVVAHRLAAGSRELAAWHGEAVQRLAENLAEYWTEERPLLLRPADAARFRRESGALQSEVARLESRIERLERGGGR
jgi:ubiquinone biosynthesis accessory factor UbiJ